MWDLDEAIEYYKNSGASSDQNELRALLSEISEENSQTIPKSCIKIIAQRLSIKESFILAIIGRMPRVRIEQSHVIEICTGKMCSKSREIISFAEKIKDKDENLIIKYVPCMHMCKMGPNIRFDGKIYSQADKNLIESLLK